MEHCALKRFFIYPRYNQYNLETSLDKEKDIIFNLRPCLTYPKTYLSRSDSWKNIDHQFESSILIIYIFLYFDDQLR